MKHFYKLYEKDEELVKIASVFFKDGLDKGEFCFWIIPDSLKKENAINNLRNYIELIDHYFKKGQIDIINASECYWSDGKFDADVMIEKWKNIYDKAVKDGFSALRAIGVTDNIEEKDWKAFVDYEARINDMIKYYDITALCVYNIKNLKSIVHISDVVNNHEGCFSDR